MHGKRVSMALVCLVGVVIGLWLGGGLPAAWGEDETKTSEPTLQRPPFSLDPELIWNFHAHEKVRKGDMIELAQLDSRKTRQRALVITHLEIRTRDSMRVQVVEHKKDPEKVRRDGKPYWNKKIRRGEGFSFGTKDSTTRWISSGYSTLVGMKFDAGTRPALEVSQGSGEIWIYAEGYWSRR